MRWRLVLDNETLPKFNLAREEAVLRARQQGFCGDTLRLWRNNKSVVVGCFCDPRSEVNLDLCARMEVQVVKRTSGGGAVYHDLGNLNFSAIYSTSTSKIPNDVLEVYRRFSMSVIAGLSTVGVKATFRLPNSIMSHDKKVSGLAIHRLHDACLIHGTLLLNADLKILHQVLRNVKDKVANLSEMYPHLSMNEVEMAVTEGFRFSLGIDLENGELNEREIRLANELHRLKYASDMWNLGDSRS